VPEADEEIRCEADEAPADEQEEEVPACTSMSIAKTKSEMYAK
jgi:hypothetical protein